jgi:hypothetical protein
MARTVSRRLAALKPWCLLGLTLFGTVGLLAAVPAWSDAPLSADAVKAAFLYRFAGYVEWPPELRDAPEFTIAVLGADGVADQLPLLVNGHAIGGRPARVRLIHELRELGSAQMLYVGRDQVGDLRGLIERIGRRPLLVVTDDERGLESGATINFLLLDRRVRFEVSLPAAERGELRVSSELLSVAARVLPSTVRTGALGPPGQF